MVLADYCFSFLSRGPLVFCLLLSMFLSMRASGEQSSLVFSGVFTIVWIGEAVVTLQIKLLGGNMYVKSSVGIPGFLLTAVPTVRSSSLSALSATLSSLWLLPLCSALSVFRLSPVYRSI